jgi:hypothetical protein
MAICERVLVPEKREKAQKLVYEEKAEERWS